MKRSYTTYAFHCKHEAKKLGVSLDELLATVDRASREGNRKDRGMASAYAVLNTVEKLIDEGKAMHIFMPSREFCDWLVSCVKESDPAHAFFLQKLIGVGVPGVFHFPCDAKLDSFTFIIPASETKVDVLGANSWKVVPAGSFLYVAASRSHPEFELFCCEIGHEDSVLNARPISSYITKLIVGLGMYAACFPEVIKPGPPTELKHPSQHQYRESVQVGVADEVFSAGGTHESPVAHYRKGHFRVLRSERFTHKRFQAVFVRDTFVKGRALTVLSPEEAP